MRNLYHNLRHASSNGLNKRKIVELLLSCTEAIILRSGVVSSCPFPDESFCIEAGECKILSSIDTFQLLAETSNAKSAIAAKKRGVFLKADNHDVQQIWKKLVMERWIQDLDDKEFIKNLLKKLGPLEILVAAYKYLKNSKQDSNEESQLGYWAKSSLDAYLIQIAKKLHYKKCFTDEEFSFRLAHTAFRDPYSPWFELGDPLRSGLALPLLPVIDMKELENGLRDFRDAYFYLRQMAFAERVDQKCLEKVMEKLRFQDTAIQRFLLMNRIGWISERNLNLKCRINCDSVFTHDPPQNPDFPEMIQLKDEVRDQWPSWPYFVAIDKSSWDLAGTLISHGFNCMCIANLQNGEITDSEMKMIEYLKLKELKPIIILTETQQEILQARNKWKELKLRLDGLHIVWGPTPSVLLKCLQTNDFEPLKCEIRCLYDGTPLIEDQRTGCIPRKMCIKCRNIYSLDELDWISRRNYALYSRFSNQGVSRNSNHDGKTPQEDVLQTQALPRDEGNPRNSVAGYSENLRRDSDFEQLGPLTSDTYELSQKNKKVGRCPFIGLEDPLGSEVDLPIFPKIDEKELEKGLHCSGDAHFYLRQIAYAKEINLGHLEKVLKKIYTNSTFEYSVLKTRLRWILSRVSAHDLEHLSYYMNLIAHDPPQDLFSPEEMRELENQGREQWRAWPHFVAIDKYNWILAHTLISHGFNCIRIADLQSGAISDDEMKRIKQHNAIVVFTEKQQKILDASKKWRPLLEQLDGVAVAWGPIRHVLNQCLQVKNFEPLKCSYRCLQDGTPLIEDRRTGCIPRKMCIKCGSIYSLDELDWISRRNHALYSRFSNQVVSRNSNHDGKTPQEDVLQTQALSRDQGNSRSSVAGYSENLRRDSDFEQLGPLTSDTYEPSQRDEEDGFPFIELKDPLRSGVDLPIFPKIDEKELEKGLRYFGDANFYLRQIAYAKETNLGHLEKVLKKIYINSTFEYSVLRTRLRWILSRVSAHDLEQLSYYMNLIAHDPPQHPFSPEEMRELENQGREQWQAWPHFVAIDKYNWALACYLISHGFNCIRIAGLQHGVISDDEMKRIKQHNAIVVFTDKQQGILDASKKWRPLLEQLKGVDVAWGSINLILKKCLKIKNFEPLKCSYRCLQDGTPLIEDHRTDCIPRGVCVSCKSVYSFEELDWVIERNRALHAILPLRLLGCFRRVDEFKARCYGTPIRQSEFSPRYSTANSPILTATVESEFTAFG